MKLYKKILNLFVFLKSALYSKWTYFQILYIEHLKKQNHPIFKLLQKKIYLFNEEPNEKILSNLSKVVHKNQLSNVKNLQ